MKVIEKAQAYDAIMQRRKNIGRATTKTKGFGSLTKEERSEIGRVAAKKRWENVKKTLDKP